MAGKIPENIIEDILSRVDIVQLIAEYIPLKRAGRNFRALCPFHHEKTPSFMISPDRQIYHCFGCGKGGNAIGFLIEYERLEFPEAVEALARRTGVVLPALTQQDTKTASLTAQLYRVNELACAFYTQILGSHAAGKIKDYLLKRGLRQDSIELFRLGCAPDKWDALISHLRAKDFSLSVLEKAGLILSRKDGGFYDRFRNRIIFPITDIKSRVLAFGARVLPHGEKAGEGVAKYVNSPETSVYIKGRNLFGLSFAKEAIRDNDLAVIVEGYLDFIIPFQGGVKNIVASCGTAFTPEQARLLKRYTHNVVVVYDPDKAGELAALRALDIFIEEGMNVRVVSLPEGLDPDLFVRENGIESFRTRINESRNLFDYKLKVLRSRFDDGQIEGRAAISAEMLSTINKFQNAVLKSEYVKRLSEELKVKEDALLHEMAKIKEPQAFSEAPEAGPRKTLNMNPAEKLLIKLMLEEADLLNRAKECISPQDFEDKKICQLVSAIFDFTGQGKPLDPNKFLNYLGAEEMTQVVCESAFLPDVGGIDKEKIMDDCIRRIKNDRLKSMRHKLQDEMHTAQQARDQDRLDSLMRQFQGLIKKRE